ncbi:MAG: mechanosensitive ion channel, partial [Sphingomonadaceae bacterium]
GAATPAQIVGIIVFTAIMLFAAIEAARQLGGSAIAALLIQITDLGGRVIFGAVIIAVGAVLAKLISGFVSSSTGESGGWAESIVRYAIIALAVAMGLRFMGLANEIVNLAFGLILGSAAVAAALAFGLGGRPTAHRLLEKWTRENEVPPAPKNPTPPAA